MREQPIGIDHSQLIFPARQRRRWLDAHNPDRIRPLGASSEQPRF